jgi:hypothetical protein
VGRYKSAAQQRREKESRTAIAKIAFVALVLVAIVVVYFEVVGSRRQLDPQTLCPASPDSLTVLLVDVTDPMNLPQRQDFTNELERLRSSIPRYGKLEIFKVDAASDHLLQPVIARCNPGTGQDENEWTGNPAAAAARWQKQFKEPLDQAFSKISAASGADRSPILESVQSIALTELKNEAADGKPRRLIVASDLLQNTDRLSFYGRLPSPEEVLRSDAFQAVRTDLRDIDVELWMLQRVDSKTSQPRALADLWDAMISEMGGRVERVYRVSG